MYKYKILYYINSVKEITDKCDYRYLLNNFVLITYLILIFFERLGTKLMIIKYPNNIYFFK